MNPETSISVLMPVFNAEKYLREAIESILNQTFTDFELIIINDGSMDGSKAIIQSFSDRRIRYVENETNLGVVKTANKGIDLCRGKYTIRMDADDISLPGRLEQQYRFMEEHPDIGVCSSWAQVIDEQGSVTGKIILQTDPELVLIHLLFSVSLIQPACCIRTKLLKENKYQQEPVTEDYELWSRLSDITRMANIPEFLIQYRWHATNISKEKERIMAEIKREIIAGELQKLHLQPSDAEMRIHTLSFSLHGFNQTSGAATVQLSDLTATKQWFKRLVAANNQVKRYNSYAFKAYLWSRWMVLCLFLKQKGKIVNPSFAGYHPRTIYYLWKQLVWLSHK
ncbi:glycosyl transferase [Bacteroidia bacterium]|nr:glycosyl transferase [Bacteroidia bacterium]